MSGPVEWLSPVLVICARGFLVLGCCRRLCLTLANDRQPPVRREQPDCPSANAQYLSTATTTSKDIRLPSQYRTSFDPKLQLAARIQTSTCQPSRRCYSYHQPGPYYGHRVAASSPGKLLNCSLLFARCVLLLRCLLPFTSCKPLYTLRKFSAWNQTIASLSTKKPP